MTDDIVARLREPKRWEYWNGYMLNFESKAPFEAADEIERLRAEIERLTRERDEAREYAVKRSKEAHAIELELHSRAEAAERKVEVLQKELLHWKYEVTNVTDFILARRMWDAYAIQAGGKTFDGKPLPTWEELGEDRQACWLAAAEAARAALKETEQ